MKRAIVGCLILFAATLWSAQPVAAHGGSESDLTSDYRTRINDAPDIDGLDVHTVGLDGTIRLSWTGTGTLIVAGYEGEPYLRFDHTGVAVNMRSPAAYLNQDRYANTQVPADADPTAEPDWRTETNATTHEWHDHRTHWMSTTLPPQAQQDPDRAHVIIERWEIPIDIDSQEATIAGDLTWTSAPPLWPWLAVVALVTLAASAVLWSPVWRPAAAVLAAIGTLALTIDTAGFVAATSDNLANKTWAFAYPAVALAATVRLIVHARRHTPDPTLAMMTAGLVLALMGGVDRFDVLTSGFYESDLDITAARTTTIICLALGLALVGRFLHFLIPLLATNPTANTTGEPLGEAQPTT